MRARGHALSQDCIERRHCTSIVQCKRSEAANELCLRRHLQSTKNIPKFKMSANEPDDVAYGFVVFTEEFPANAPNIITRRTRRQCRIGTAGGRAFDKLFLHSMGFLPFFLHLLDTVYENFSSYSCPNIRTFSSNASRSSSSSSADSVFFFDFADFFSTFCAALAFFAALAAALFSLPVFFLAMMGRGRACADDRRYLWL
jgi:hypothetical protein